MKPQPKTLRCAVYTRVSTEYGLEQDFNSLDAQREASEAYIKSQSHEGWRLQPGNYDDGGFSGGTLDRPALQKLLTAIRQRKIDVVVVYKVDRLTRSLADFAKLVELFDAHDVSFVSVTQSFNTTTSMGRLTLNVLLSFAQFEREVTGERIRDKIAASKRKGMRMGGPTPLGYDVVDKKLVPNAEEAERVRDIFRTYVEQKSLIKTLVDLYSRNIVTKRSSRRDGSFRGGIAFNKSGLVHLLQNRVYRGEVVHKGNYFPGEHAAIVDAELFATAQRVMGSNTCQRESARLPHAYLLAGKLYDDAGNRMSPVTARKNGRHYRYYVSVAESQGRKPGTVARASADDLEETVLSSIPLEIRERHGSSATAIRSVVEKILVQASQLQIHFVAARGSKRKPAIIPWSAPTRTRKREVLLPSDAVAAEGRIRSENRARLLAGMATARRWVDELISKKSSTTETIALHEGISERSVRMNINLAFIAPDIVAAIIAGTAPKSLKLEFGANAPPSWIDQLDKMSC
ncbi:DNA-invertase hin [Variibacter gotjawalensis]|uniref:DNA-invertase hin n=1 Tax=Variibacter gotjawalensis TaxID=1333996 RepID=A0A0S3PRZ2_9BRAD|nr:recombinase family protein [Variibacter gotjawalensis]NIK48900.1 DNA invertase Pin-like site-specific DNA recombinase [Variibacter gotjawalensis]RZS50756.1 DNA invertase Pin-like site-specific DNA recombinase [Variibacter gotjawalensis]BAT58590.1 DNA-invertase hin [Variibacter gotjawalensis]